MNDVPRDDEGLLAQLSSALTQSDPVPERVLDGARAAFTWRTIDAELASIVFDSTQDLAGVRSAVVDSHERQLTFRTDDGDHEIEVMLIDDTDGGRGRRMVGQIIPPAERTVRLTARDVESVVQTDSLGRFTFDDVPTSPVRLDVLDDDESQFATQWIVL